MSKEFGFDVPTVITTRSFFAPESKDAPKSYIRKFSYYGSSRKDLIKLAHELNAYDSTGPIFMVGTARAIDARLKTGQCFIVSRLVDRSGNSLLLSPSELKFLPQAELMLVEDQKMDTKQKALLYATQRSSLIDADFQYFWSALKPELREKLIIIRSVTEEASEAFDPEAKDRRSWTDMLEHSSVLNYASRIISHERYQSEITDIFERMMRTNALIESIDPASFAVSKKA
jgi:hypothetical protein